MPETPPSTVPSTSPTSPGGPGRTGRPGSGEHSEYASRYVDLVPGDDALALLAAQEEGILALVAPLGEEEARGLTYAPGKWTVKEVLGHLVDTERVFVTRALGVARQDPEVRPSFDENLYGRTAGYEQRALGDVLDEMRAVRRSTLAFFAGLPAEAWRQIGIVNGSPTSVRGLAFQLAGHELHHARILRERYLTES